MHVRAITTVGALLGSLALCASARGAEDPRPATHLEVVPNPEYQVGPLHRFLLGSGYRKLWATPIDVEVLNLATFSGGLTPDEKGGGKQTKALKFKAADGRKWKFRSIDKDPTPVLPKALQHGLPDKLVQDQISASHPGNALVVDALAKAAGIPTVPRTLVVLPDDPRLGEFRQEFAGMLGTLEENAGVETPGFERFSEVLDMPELWERMDNDASERVDERALLKARLFDMLIGDYDRHQGQWDFGKDRASGRWVPVPKDRDLAFVKFDGLVLDLVRPSLPKLVDFEDKYPSIVGLNWQGRFVDRRHLASLDRKDWEAAAAELQDQLTDAVIDDAVRRLPPEFYAIDGPGLARRLKARRGSVPEAARRSYELLAKEAELHATDQADTVEASRAPDGSLELTASGPGGPYFHRRFLPFETREVRVFLKGGDDRAVTRGHGKPGVKLRVVGGDGADLLDDREAGHTRFYDALGENGVKRGPGTKVSDRPNQARLDINGNPPRDWGATTLFLPWARAGGGLGVVLGGELRRTTYGFRRDPWGSQHSLRVGYSTFLRDFGAEYDYQSRRTDNRARFGLDAKISKLELIRFHGFGNESQAPGSEDFYDVKQRQYALAPSYRLELDAVDIELGPIAKFADTRLGGPSLLALERPYGSEGFGQVGARIGLKLDRRDYRRAATRGLLLATEASVYPAVWSVEETFGHARGEAAVYATAPIVLRPTLALRAGGQKVWGRYPFHEAAYLGGSETVRGLRSQRYAGDASVYGNAELRLALRGQARGLLPRFGVFGLADGGRVFVQDESSNRWHTAVGGGVWIGLANPENVVSLAVARSEGRVYVYLQGGFMF